MSKYTIEVTKPRLFGKPLVRSFDIDVDDDFGGKLWINKKMQIQVKVSPHQPQAY
jgi:hypothetical protein